MIVPMDEPSGRVIEFKPADTSSAPLVDIKPKDWTKHPCNHGKFQVDPDNRTVQCGHCNQQLDAMHVLCLIAHSESRRRYWVTSAEEHNRKECAKTIKFAVIALGKRKVDPQKFAVLYEKYVNGAENAEKQK